MKPFVYIMTFCSLLLLTSCYSVKTIKIRPGEGGVVAVNPGFKTVTDPDVRAAALRVMEQNCGVGNVKIIEEGYVTIGQEKKTDIDVETRKEKAGSWFGKGKRKTGGTRARTVNIDQWQITYKCLN